MRIECIQNHCFLSHLYNVTYDFLQLYLPLEVRSLSFQTHRKGVRRCRIHPCGAPYELPSARLASVVGGVPSRSNLLRLPEPQVSAGNSTPGHYRWRASLTAQSHPISPHDPATRKYRLSSVLQVHNRSEIIQISREASC